MEPLAPAPENIVPSSAIRVLSLSCVFPNANDPGLGMFVQSRLWHLSSLAEIKIIAPVPQLNYAKSEEFWCDRVKVPAWESDNGIEVFRPAWIYPPGGFSWNAVLLFLRLVPLVLGIRRRFQFQVIDAHFAFPDGIVACLLAEAIGVPFTVTLRGNETMHAKYPLRRKLMAWSLAKASRIITLSKPLRQFAIAMGVDAEKVKIIPNGVDPLTFRPHHLAGCRAKYGLRPETKVILSAGSLIERKGHHRVAQSVAALLKSGLNVELIIAGGAGREGKYEAQLRRHISDLGIQKNVRLLGEVSPQSLAELMTAADVLCLASTREGWPNVVHEALACGTPVVATDVGAVSDMIPTSDYGLIVPVGDALALDRALYQALTKEWDYGEISAWALSRTWEQVGREVFSELRDVVAAEGLMR